MKYIAYFRVSTERQGRSGLGLEAQQKLVQQYEADIIGRYHEIESGKNDNRPELQAALEECRAKDAALLIAKIDRLSRDAAFLFTLRKAGVEIVAADMPHAGTLEFGIRAVFAQHEREEISKRTKAALQAAKARGKKLGCPNPHAGGGVVGQRLHADAVAYAKQIAPVVRDIKDSGAQTLREVAAALSQRAIPTRTGNTVWSLSQVALLLRRI